MSSAKQPTARTQRLLQARARQHQRLGGYPYAGCIMVRTTQMHPMESKIMGIAFRACGADSELRFDYTQHSPRPWARRGPG